MEREIITRIGPVCKFGPGGDYESIWPADWQGSANRPKNALAGLLNVFTGIIDVLRGSEREYYIEGPTEIDESFDQETIKNVSKPGMAYSPASPGAKRNHGFSEQIWLFADNWRAGRPAKYQPNHGLRAHRAVAKKRTYFRTSGQSTLFDPQLKGTKTA